MLRTLATLRMLRSPILILVSLCILARCANAQRSNMLLDGPIVPLVIEKRTVGEDSKRAYWLIAPRSRNYYRNGFRIGFRERLLLVDPHEDPDPHTVHSNAPGLLVVLPGSDGSGDSAITFWKEAAEKVLKGRYLVAIPISPRWSATQQTAWLTASTLKSVKEAKFTTESFVNDVVTDITKSRAINPDHIFLHGVSESGLAAYACSLEETSPFQGFYILSSPFKSTQLPTLAHARGRRYYLQHSKDDKIVPYWMAAAAEDLLKKQGATVKLAPYHGGNGYNFADDAWTSVADAISWLEGKPAPLKAQH